jgi:type 1 glutamine amidotransferase
VRWAHVVTIGDIPSLEWFQAIANGKSRIMKAILTTICLWTCVAISHAEDLKHKPLSIHIISGSNEYESEASLKELSKFLGDKYKVTCTASWGHDGSKKLDNLMALRDAELMIVFARRMKLGEEQMKIIRNHWQQGKPIVGIRTAGHAFQEEDNELFDKKVLGAHYQGHYRDEPVTVRIVSAAKDHPVLAGVGSFTSCKLYKAGKMNKNTKVLQTGDIGKAKHAVTVVHQYHGGRTFFTSLGVQDDFKNAQFRKLIVNAIFWTTDRDQAKMAK